MPAYELRRQIGYVFQGIGLFPHLSVAENIGVTPQLLGWPKNTIVERVAELVDLVGLPRNFLSRMPADLSGGQQQRVGVARAVIANPQVILADEPTGNLDSAQGKEIMELFRTLNEGGTTIVQVTHSELNASYGTRIIQLRDGWVVDEETSNQTSAATV